MIRRLLIGRILLTHHLELTCEDRIHGLLHHSVGYGFHLGGIDGETGWYMGLGLAALWIMERGALSADTLRMKTKWLYLLLDDWLLTLPLREWLSPWIFLKLNK